MNNDTFNKNLDYANVQCRRTISGNIGDIDSFDCPILKAMNSCANLLEPTRNMIFR